MVQVKLEALQDDQEQSPAQAGLFSVQPDVHDFVAMAPLSSVRLRRWKNNETTPDVIEE